MRTKLWYSFGSPDRNSPCKSLKKPLSERVWRNGDTQCSRTNNSTSVLPLFFFFLLLFQQQHDNYSSNCTFIHGETQFTTELYSFILFVYTFHTDLLPLFSIYVCTVNAQTKNCHFEDTYMKTYFKTQYDVITVWTQCLQNLSSQLCLAEDACDTFLRVSSQSIVWTQGNFFVML